MAFSTSPMQNKTAISMANPQEPLTSIVNMTDWGTTIEGSGTSSAIYKLLVISSNLLVVEWRYVKGSVGP